MSGKNRKEKIMEYLAGEGLWLRGNLHTHTTVSDGKLTPEECIRLYKEKGYDFLCITDHHKSRMGGVEDGVLIGVRIKSAWNPYGWGAVALPYREICTYYASDNNGSGSKDREDYAHLCCVTPEV